MLIILDVCHKHIILSGEVLTLMGDRTKADYIQLGVVEATVIQIVFGQT